MTKELKEWDELEHSNDFNSLEYQVIEWANNKQILSKSNPTKQTLKLVEEVGELASGVAKTNGEQLTECIEDSIGDSLVCLIILAKMYNVDTTECLKHSYDIIKNRRGEMINGIFRRDDENN